MLCAEMRSLRGSPAVFHGELKAATPASQLFTVLLECGGRRRRMPSFLASEQLRAMTLLDSLLMSRTTS